MLSPVIMLGCGGSGSKAVRYVRDAVTRRLREGGWTDPLPDAWSFIGLDTYVKQEDATEIPPLPGQDFLGLSSNLTDYRGLHEVLLQQFKPGTEPYKRHMIGWLPHPNGPRVQLQIAGGKVRAVGRAAGLYTLGDQVKKRVKQAFDHATAKSGLDEVSDQLGVAKSQQARDGDAPLVVICASMAGGTGAGIALDVVDLVRRTDDLGKFPLLVLFSNDIFGDKVSDAMAGNSLGVLCELLASYWNSSDSGGGDIFSSDVANPGHGPASVFVVGSHSMKGSNIGDNNVAVYRAVGEALSGWVTEPEIQENVQAWISGNWGQNANENRGGYPFAKDYQPGVVSSFGAAVVTVGRTRFERWARDLLCGEVLDAILKGHERADQLPPSDEKWTEFDRVDKIAEKYWPVFYGSVDVAGEALGDDAVTGLAATDRQFMRPAGKEDWVVDRFERYVENAKMAPREWLYALETAYSHCLKEVQEDARVTTERERARWGSAVVAHAAGAASDVIGETSIAVALRCIQHLDARLRENADWSHGDASEQVDVAQEARAKALGQLREARGKVRLDRNSSAVASAFETSVDLLLQEWDFVRGEVVADLVEEAVEGVYGSLRQVLEQANKAARHARDDEEARGWPEGLDSIPKQYLPTSIELPLESHSEWGALLRDLCSDARRPTTASRHPVAAARTLLIAGDVDAEQSDTGAEPLVVVDPDREEWIPGRGVASFVCKTSLKDVRLRVESWMGEGRFAGVVREGIGSYLTPDESHESTNIDYKERLDAFKHRLTEATTLAQPLVEIDTNLHSLVYRGRGDKKGVPVDLTCSSLPFDTKHEAFEAAEKVLGSDLKLRDGDTPSILVTSYIREPIHPMVVKSVRAPIANVVKGYRGDSQDLQGTFWLWRRSRTLRDFVPLAPEALENLIRGFAVGRLCGYVTADYTKPILISGWPEPGDDRKEIAFPWPFLSPMRYPTEVLPGLLESFALCFVEAGTKKLDAFEAYRRLYDLGDDERVPRLNDLDTILRGDEPPKHIVDTPQAFGKGDNSDRRQAAIEYLDRNIRYFESVEESSLIGREYRDKKGYAGKDIALREILPNARESYNRLKEEIERIGDNDDEDIV